MNQSKPVIQSRTLWSLILGILSKVLAYLGIDVEILQFEGAADGGVSLMELLELVAYLAAAYFRVIASQQIRGIK